MVPRYDKAIRFLLLIPMVAVGALIVVAVSAAAEDNDRTSKQHRWHGDRAAVSQQIEESLILQVREMMNGLSPAARSGYRHLTESSYLPSDFDEEVLLKLDEGRFQIPLKDVALAEGGRDATWERYGLAPRPNDPEKPLQYVVNARNEYVMNCFACHGGNLMGVTYPGAPNTLYALESLTEQVRRSKLSLKKPLTHMDIGSMAMPLGTTVGTSNAVMFGVALMNFRDAKLNIYPNRIPAPMINHDMDAPPWWHFARKSHLYIEGFAEKGHRGLMQFILVKQNGPEQFQAWESDFRDIYAFLSEVKPPRYPLDVDQSVAERGRAIFNQHCSDCHGTYGKGGEYPERLVPLAEIGTDSVRGKALSPKHRSSYGDSWFAHFGEQDTRIQVDGYVAPPLDGIWASAPYLHNGSVPTLWHLLHPEQRPTLWKRDRLGLDVDRMGLGIEEVDSIPKGLTAPDRRWYFDTRQFGKSNAGHDFPNVLTEEEKNEVLEYLKTL